MPDLAVAVVVAAVAGALLSAALSWGLTRKLTLKKTRQIWARARHNTNWHLLREVRVEGIRYLINVTDWDQEWEVGLADDMRWRWTIWDADGMLRREVYPQGEGDPQGQIGVELPYMLGNAPEADQALRVAWEWVRAQQDQDGTLRVVVDRATTTGEVGAG